MPASVEQVWSDCLCQVAEQIPPRTYKNWFDPLHPASLEEHGTGWLLRLEAPTRLAAEMVKERHRSLLRNVLTELLGGGVELSFAVQEGSDGAERSRDEAPALQEIRARRLERQPTQSEASPSSSSPDSDRGGGPVTSAPAGSPTTFNASGTEIASPAAAGRHATPSAKPAGQSAVPLPSTSKRLRPEYTFDHFIEGDCNSLARNAALAIAREPAATSYNPFLVYGGVGLGKTHLVQAIGNHIHDQGSERCVVYVSSEEFTSQFVRSIQNNSIAEFTRFYRQVDVLIVDDVQFFSGKEKTQEEFFHVFNTLHQDNKQIVLCADRPPPQIDGIEERLLSRFQWGLSADVQQPDLETRIAILQRKAELHSLDLPEEILHYVGHHVRESIRSLEGALARLKAHQEIGGSEIDLPLAKRLLHDVIDDRSIQLDVSDIMDVTADYYGLEVDMLPARTRKRPIVSARHVAMYFSRELTEKSLSSIGLSFGGRDHSTVVHAIQSVEDRLDTEPNFEREIEELRRQLRVTSRTP